MEETAKAVHGMENAFSGRFRLFKSVLFFIVVIILMSLLGMIIGSFWESGSVNEDDYYDGPDPYNEIYAP